MVHFFLPNNMNYETPQRVQRTRQKVGKGNGYIFPKGKENNLPIKYVGRPFKYGNSYKVGGLDDNGNVIRTKQQAVELFEYFVTVLRPEIAEMAKKELKGKNLACFCKLSEICHADVWLKIANEA